jgi:hypothetical protein
MALKTQPFNTGRSFSNISIVRMAEALVPVDYFFA